ncbi:putative cation/H+ exchanger, cation/H+ exchanger, CPA1 family, na+/H+ exchanger NHX -type [Lupinus albus]|uniref:Putative cation/H+ exchanger, cation/H+ exchanger, CPA1 family, na+/H+ exchanger NHX-type n=1 Tax=Lupinus albus TaxID=3870 RepID=A0A6A4NV64_LUPAL|nr:putative cation/H+ exchanger, cation/H+ exchanger, CPA1 family, na+/H+ exchanger NHX -type [Lupinus albus]
MQLFDLSGILTVFFCGVLMSHYAWHNVTEISRVTTRHLFAAISFIAETFIFLYVGMDALDIEKWRMTKLSLGSLIGIYSSLILLILLGRAAFVFPLSSLSNYMNRRAHPSSKITFKHQIVIWWAGLMRGAVSIALAFKQFTFSGVTSDPVNATMVTNTIIVVLFSTLVFGFLTKPLIRYLLPHNATRKNNGHEESGPHPEDMNLPFLSLEESTETNLSRAKESLSMFIESPVYTMHYYWRSFDDSYMRPIFGGPRAHFHNANTDQNHGHLSTEV